MRKFVFLFVIMLACTSAEVQAQQGADPAAAITRMKERIKPQLLEKTKLTELQVDRIIEISFEQQRQRRELRNDTSLSEEDRKKKIEELDSARDKKFSEIPLTTGQVKAVNDFFTEMRKNAPPRNQK